MQSNWVNLYIIHCLLCCHLLLWYRHNPDYYNGKVDQQIKSTHGPSGPLAQGTTVPTPVSHIRTVQQLQVCTYCRKYLTIFVGLYGMSGEGVSMCIYLYLVRSASRLVDSLNGTCCNRLAFIQPTAGLLQVWGKPNLLHYLLVLRCSMHMLWIQSMPSMPYGSMHLPIGWNGLSMTTEVCSVVMPIVIINFKVRGVK